MTDITASLKTYQKHTHSTAIYPKEHAVSYLTMGLANEISEFGNAETLDAAIKELGDLFWFTSELANLINADLSALYIQPDDWTTPAGDGFVMAVLTQELQDVMGSVAKFLRDGTSYQEAMLIFLSRTVKCLDSVCDTLNIDIPALLQNNLEKLQDRKNRGVLGGSGDSR